MSLSPDDNPWSAQRSSSGPKKGPASPSGGSGGGPDFFQFFKGKQGGEAPFQPLVFLGIFGALFLLWLGSGFYTVEERQQAMVLRLGTYVDTVGAGLRYHFPYPFEEVIVRNVATHKALENDGGRGGYSDDQGHGVRGDKDFYMLTGDRNLVELSRYTVVWRIKDLKKFLLNVRGPEGMISATADSVLREEVARTPINLIITEKRAQVNDHVTAALQNLLDRYDSGVQVVSFIIQKADPPEPVLDAFLDVTRAEADKERSQHEGRGYRDEILPKARAKANAALRVAEAYAQKVVAEAEGESGRFRSVLSEHHKAPKLTELRLYHGMMEAVWGGASKIISEMPTLPHFGLSFKESTQKGAP